MSRRSGSTLFAAQLLAVLLLAVPLAAGAEDSLDPAANAVESGDWQRGLSLLEAAFDAGHPNPTDVLADPRFAALRGSVESRRAWRALMSRHVRQSEVTMVPPGEPGAPMLVRGRVVAWPGGEPVAGAVLELYHTDATGTYEPGQAVGEDRTSRLFAYVRSDDRGRFTVHSIEPAPYPGASPGAAHIHYIVSADGYRTYSHDFRPYDHPRTPEARARATADGQRVSTVERRDGRLIVDVTVPLRRAER